MKKLVSVASFLCFLLTASLLLPEQADAHRRRHYHKHYHCHWKHGYRVCHVHTHWAYGHHAARYHHGH